MSEKMEALIEKREQKKMFDALKNLMSNMKWTIEQAMDAIGVP